MLENANKLSFSRTKLAVLWTSVLNEPLLTMYSLFAFILHKDLGASVLQIGVLTMLKPMASLCSLYWSSYVARKPSKILSNVIWAGVLSRIPFLFFPFIDNSWFFIAAIVFYIMLYRGGLPAWVEILKINLPEKVRGSIYSWGSAIGYIEGVLLALGVGYLLDNHAGMWKFMFPISAIIGLCGVMLQKRIPIETKEDKKEEPFTVPQLFLKPWKDSWNILKIDKSFRGFQLGVFICGFGVMVIQPALPLFFMDVLGLSYTDLAVALSIWKGIGYAVTSPVWGKYFSFVNIYRFTSYIFVFMGLFPALLLFAPIDTMWVYIAYLAYGVAQAGCHLSWNLSGPQFAKNEDSSLYSGVNILMVGVRGSFIPPLGSLLCTLLGPVAVLCFGAFLCFYSAYYIRGWMTKESRTKAVESL